MLSLHGAYYVLDTVSGFNVVSRGQLGLGGEKERESEEEERVLACYDIFDVVVVTDRGIYDIASAEDHQQQYHDQKYNEQCAGGVEVENNGALQLGLVRSHDTVRQSALVRLSDNPEDRRASSVVTVVENGRLEVFSPAEMADYGAYGYDGYAYDEHG